VQPVAVAKRYARALADYVESGPKEGGRAAGKDPARLEPVAAELDLVCRILQQDPRFERFFANPSIDQKAKKTALEAVAKKAKLSDAVRAFLGVLVTNRRLGAIRAVRDAFDAEKDERMGILPAETTTAVPLSAAELKRLREALEKMTGSKVRVTQQVDPGLLGGARTRIGSRVYDGTLRQKLDALRDRLVGAH
jgi:F-type H+-transporting ATPase subunit delta